MANGVTIDLIVDPKKAIQGLGQVEDKSTGVSNALGKLGGAAAAGVAALAVATTAAAAATGAFLVSAVKAAAESEKVTAQTAAVIASTGGAAGKSADQIDALSTQLSRMSGIDDETVKSGENLLLTFTNIQGTTFDRATQSALDMSVAMGTDLNSSVIQLGKALNDPIAGITKLQKVGVTFTDQQKDQIASYVKLGDTAAAQGVILDEVNREFGGSAEAFGNTFQGAVGKVQTEFGNLKETIGGVLLPSLTSVLGQGLAPLLIGFQDLIQGAPNAEAEVNAAAQGLVAGIQQVGPALDALAGSIGTALTAAAPALQEVGSAVIAALATILPGLFTAAAGLVGGLVSGIVTAAPGIITAIIPALLSLVSTVLGLLPKLLDAGLQIVVALAEGVTAALPTLIPVALGAILGLVSTLVANLPLILNAGLQLIVGLATGLIAALPTLIGALPDIIVSLVSFLIAAIPQLIQAGISLLTSLVGALPDIITAIVEALPQIIVGIITALLTAIPQLIEAGIKLLVALVGDIPQIIIALIAAVPEIITGLVKAFGDPDTLAQMGKAGLQLIQGLWEGIKGAGDWLWKQLKGFFGGIIDQVKGLLGIHSPSTVFAGLGGNLIAGLVDGISGGAGVVGAAMTALSRQVTGGFSGSLDVQARATLAGGFGPDEGDATNSSSAAAAPINMPIYMLPEQDPRIVGRQLGREVARTLAGSPA